MIILVWFFLRCEVSSARHGELQKTKGIKQRNNIAKCLHFRSLGEGVRCEGIEPPGKNQINLPKTTEKQVRNMPKTAYVSLIHFRTNYPNFSRRKSGKE